MPEVKLAARYSSWYRSDNPTFVFYNYRTYMALRSSGPAMQSVVYFTNPFTLPKMSVVSAKLRFTMVGGTTNTGTRSISIQRLGRGVNFTKMTYNTRPTVFAGTTKSVSTTGPLGDRHVFEFDVTSDMQAIASGAPFYGWIVTTTAPFVISLHAHNSKYPPQLVMNYTIPPTMPKELSPSAGRVVGLAKPYVTFSYFDSSGSDEFSAVRLQTSPSSGFGTISWDSGTVLTGGAGLELSTTNYPGATEGVPVFYRVMVRNMAGVWSSWSTPTSFVYQRHPTIAITNPTPGGTFSDPTPTIGWTYSSPTGSPQGKYRVRVHREDARGRLTLVQDSGLQAGAADNWTPSKANSGPKGWFELEVWDSYNREATIDDFGGSKIVGWASFSPVTGPVPPPLNLAHNIQYPRPEVNLTWERADAPDFWTLYRDGEFVFKVPGPDLLVAPGKYAYRDYAPKGNHNWTVRAIVNGQYSVKVTINGDVDFKGIWLYDEDGSAVCLQDDREHNLTMPEVFAVHEPLGSSKAVVVTQALRGYEGTLEGLITELKGAGEAPEVWRANLLRFKSSPSTLRTLVLEDLVLPVCTSDIQIKGAPGRRGWRASFSVYQQDDFLFDPLEA